MYKFFSNPVIYTGNEVIAGKGVLIKNNLIVDIIDSGSIPTDCEIIDCSGLNIAPGLIDLQIAGGGGFLFSSFPTADAIDKIAASIVSTGTTSFLIVLPTNSMDVYLKAIEAIKTHPHPAIPGLHFEGPWINMAKRGAHSVDHIQKPDLQEIEKLLKVADGVIKMITVAPELCSRDMIRLMRDNGVVVCAGHSNATFMEAREGFDSGIQSVTHLFNAMSILHHRDPGLPGAVFEMENISASIIADGIHVDYNTISIAKKLMKERLYLVSDAVEESNSGAVQHIRKADRFVLPDGTLSGSALTMMQAVKNCVEKVGISIDEALRMGSTYPARLMGFSDVGKIKGGYKADLVVFDKDFEIKEVFKGGEMQK
jgi:N-acetylglucosamine-6-phosphate deacetylase